MSDARWWERNGGHVLRSALLDEVDAAEEDFALAKRRLEAFDAMESERRRATARLHKLFARDWAEGVSANRLRDLETTVDGDSR